MSSPTDTHGFYADMGRRVRKARQARKLTQEQLALQLSLKRTSITNIERGRQQLLAHTLVQLADVLDVPLESLVPVRRDAAVNLTAVLRERPAQEQDWIRAAVASSRPDTTE